MLRGLERALHETMIMRDVMNDVKLITSRIS